MSLVSKSRLEKMEIDQRIELLDGRVVIFRFEEGYWIMDENDNRSGGWEVPNADEVINFLGKDGSKRAKPLLTDPSILPHRV